MLGGMQIDVASSIGIILADQILKTITEEEMNAVVRYLKTDIFENIHTHFPEEKDVIKVREVLNDKRHRTGESEYVPYSPLIKETKKLFQDKFKEMIIKEIDKILDSDTFKGYIDNIATEIIDYSVEGYKKDMVDSIRLKMGVYPVQTDMTYVNGTSLRDVIHAEFDNILKSYTR